MRKEESLQGLSGDWKAQWRTVTDHNLRVKRLVPYKVELDTWGNSIFSRFKRWPPIVVLFFPFSSQLEPLFLLCIPTDPSAPSVSLSETTRTGDGTKNHNMKGEVSDVGWRDNVLTCTLGPRRLVPNEKGTQPVTRFHLFTTFSTRSISLKDLGTISPICRSLCTWASSGLRQKERPDRLYTWPSPSHPFFSWVYFNRHFFRSIFLVTRHTTRSQSNWRTCY